MTPKRTNPTRSNRSSGWLQTFIVTGSLAATVVGAGMISRMEGFKTDLNAEEATDLGIDPVALEPIPTLIDPAFEDRVANNNEILLPTPTPIVAQQSNAPAVIPTDTPEATWTPAPTATPVVIRQSQSTQQVPTTVRRRSRSSR